MKKIIQMLSIFALFTLFSASCTKESQAPEPTLLEETVDTIEVGVLERSESLNLNWQAQTGVDLQYQVINTANNNVLFTKTWTTCLTAEDYFTAPDNLCLKVILKVRRLNAGPGTVKLWWNWTRASCISTNSGLYKVSAPSGTPWESILPYYITTQSCPCS